MKTHAGERNYKRRVIRVEKSDIKKYIWPYNEFCCKMDNKTNNGLTN